MEVKPINEQIEENKERIGTPSLGLASWFSISRQKLKIVQIERDIHICEPCSVKRGPTVCLKYITSRKSSQNYGSKMATFFNPFSNDQISDSSKLKEFADDYFEFDENGRKFSKWVENTVEQERQIVATYARHTQSCNGKIQV